LTEALKNVINKAYLEGFLNASYKETTNYDADSPANNFRKDSKIPWSGFPWKTTRKKTSSSCGSRPICPQTVK
jgi:hypothetical protein